MLRLTFYLALTLVALVATFVSPVGGVVACLGAYLLNPSIFLGDDILRFQLVTSAAFILTVMIHRPAGVPRAGREGRIIVMLWVFLAIGFASALWAEVSSQQALDAIYEVFKTVLFVTLMVKAIEREDQLSLVLTACIAGVWHAALAHTFGVRWGYVPNRFGAEFGVLPDVQMPVMVLFVPLLIVIAIFNRGRQRLLAAMALPFVVNSIVVTYRRTGFVSLAVEAALLMLLLPARVKLRAAPFVAAAVCLFVFRLAPEDYWERMNTITTPTEERSANSRLVVTGASLRMLADHPFGVGYRNYPVVSPRYLAPEYLTEGRRSSHNSYFAIACETGLPGFVAWISAFLGGVLLLRRIRKTTDWRAPSRVAVYAIGLEFGMYGWFAGGVFQADHEVDPAYWFLGFAVILTRLHARARQAAPEAEAPAEEAVLTS